MSTIRFDGWLGGATTTTEPELSELDRHTQQLIELLKELKRVTTEFNAVDTARQVAEKEVKLLREVIQTKDDLIATLKSNKAAFQRDYFVGVNIPATPVPVAVNPHPGVTIEDCPPSDDH